MSTRGAFSGRWSYDRLLTFFEGRRSKGNDYRTINKNLSVHLRRSGVDPDAQPDVAVRMYNTDIVTFHPDNSRTIRCNGWEDSVTTRANIEDISGKRIFSVPSSRRHLFTEPTRISVGMGRYWAPEGQRLDGHVYGQGIPYRDGLTFNAFGELVSPPEGFDVETIREADPEWRKRVLALKRELWKLLRPFFVFHASAQECIERAGRLRSDTYRLREWVEDILELVETNDLDTNDLPGIAMTLIGATVPQPSWRRSEVDLTPTLAKRYAQAAFAKIGGKGGFDLYGSIEREVRSWEV